MVNVRKNGPMKRHRDEIIEIPDDGVHFFWLQDRKQRRILYLLGKFLEVRPRRFKMATQGIVNDQLAFQATIVGMPI